MKENKYLKWLAENTQSSWWHDSADPDEMDSGIGNGAVGATTNPLLIQMSLSSRTAIWKPALAELPSNLSGDEKSERILGCITEKLSKKLFPIYRATNGAQGFVCAQVNPNKPGDVDVMLATARRYAALAPNISVKLPVTRAGLEVLEECTAEGISVTMTASFTVPQALAVGESYARGAQRARGKGIKPNRCFAVLMIGRLDDYLRDVAHDNRSCISEEDILWSGIAVAKRTYALFAERGYEPVIMPAGLRGTYHVTELAGATMVFSVAPKIQNMLAELEAPFEERIDKPVDPAIIKRLSSLPEFVRGFEPDGLSQNEFITYGVTQKTLSQFVEAGWLPIERFSI